MHAYSSKELSILLLSYILSTVLLMTSPLSRGLGAEAAATGCASCALQTMDKESEEKLMIEIAKQQILSKLHLKERPNITHTVPRAALVTALRKLHAGRVRPDGTLELENDLASTRDQGYEIVSFADLDDMDTSGVSTSRLTFTFGQERAHRVQVLQTSLWLYARASETGAARVPAQIFLSSGEPGASNRTLVLQKLLEVQRGGWHTFPLAPTLQRFLDGGRSRLQLEVTCGDEGGANLCHPGGTADAASRRPFLVAQVRRRADDDLSEHVLRRRALRCGDDSSICCKKDFYIRFKDIQWQDWIIAPEGYHINYCRGQCPQHLAGSPGIASSVHATVFSLLKANGINTAVSSCCVPIQRRPLSMVYFDTQHSIIKKDMPDMIVESCGCT